MFKRLTREELAKEGVEVDEESYDTVFTVALEAQRLYDEKQMIKWMECHQVDTDGRMAHSAMEYFRMDIKHIDWQSLKGK